MDNRIIARLIGAKKVYRNGDAAITALNTCNIEIFKGELMLIMGPSGSGKTTLLSLIGCVIYPTEGSVELKGKIVSELSQKKLAKVRLNEIGFVFQHFNLLQPLTALENVMQPLQLQNRKISQIKEKAESAIRSVELSDRKNNLPKKLSGGQKQRVAIARALVTDAPIILCDEPTASLDAKSATIVMNELKILANNGKAVVVVTHDLRLRPFADRILYVENGMLTTTLKEESLYK